MVANPCGTMRRIQRNSIRGQKAIAAEKTDQERSWSKNTQGNAKEGEAQRRQWKNTSSRIFYLGKSKGVRV